MAPGWAGVELAGRYAWGGEGWSSGVSIFIALLYNLVASWTYMGWDQGELLMTHVGGGQEQLISARYVMPTTAHEPSPSKQGIRSVLPSRLVGH